LATTRRSRLQVSDVRYRNDDALELLDRPGAGVEVRGPRPRAQQVVAAEDVQREIAAALVIAVGGAAELVAVDRVVGGVEVQDDPLGRSGVGLEEEVHEEAFDVAGAAGDLLVAAASIGTDGGQFQTIQGALAGQGLAAIATALSRPARGVGLADDGGQERVASQVVMVVEVLIAQGQGIDPLGDQLVGRVFDPVGFAVAGEAGGELMDDAGELLGLAEQQGTAVGGDVAAIEVRDDFAPAEHGKVEVGGVTLCGHRAALGRCRRWLVTLHL
jgi:hypothetical protein